MMRNARAMLLAAVVAGALSGCAGTPTEWAKPGAAPAQVAKDQAECEEKAYWQALDESSSSRPLYPPYTGTGFGWGPPFHSVESPSYFARGPRQYEFTDYCMRERGYTLRPVSRPA